MNPSNKSNELTSIAFSMLLILLVSACGGGGGSSEAPPAQVRKAGNIVPISVYSAGNFYALNMPFVSVKVCDPSNSNCTTIDNVLVDTGSVGLRVFASAVSTLNLTQQTVTGTQGDNPIAECLTFTQGITWGPVKYATVQIGEKTANNIPIQVISDPGFTSIPTVCSNEGTVLNTITNLGANGILGIGSLRQDSGWYFRCNNSGANCAYVTQPIANRIPNPVAEFESDNNGVIITLGDVPDSGTSAINGTLTFGIDTQSNNASLHANTILINNDPNSPTYGYFNTVVNGINYPYSFIDSGSNGYFFNMPITITECFLYPGFYCPGNTMTLNATITGHPGSTAPVSFNFDVGNAGVLLSNYDYFVFDNLGGTAVNNEVFDWGLPFFIGKSVYVAMEGSTTAKGTGPYVGW